MPGERGTKRKGRRNGRVERLKARLARRRAKRVRPLGGGAVEDGNEKR